MGTRGIGSSVPGGTSVGAARLGRAQRPVEQGSVGSSAATPQPRAPASTRAGFKGMLRHLIAAVAPPSAGRAHVVSDPGYGERMSAALNAGDLTALKELIERLPRRGSEQDRACWVGELLAHALAADRPPADCAEITVSVLRQAPRLPAAAQDALFEALLSLAGRSREQGNFYQTSYWLQSAEELADSPSLSPERRCAAVDACRSERLAWNAGTPDDTLVWLASDIGSSRADQMGDKVHALLVAAQGRPEATRAAVLEILAARARRLSAQALRQVAVAALEQLARPADVLSGLLDQVEGLPQGPEAAAIWWAVERALSRHPDPQARPALEHRLASLRDRLPDWDLKGSDQHVVVRVWPAMTRLGVPTHHYGHASMSVRQGAESSYLCWSDDDDPKRSCVMFPDPVDRYDVDKGFGLAARAKEGLRSGRLQPRPGQKELRHNGIVFDWGVSARKIYLPLCGSASPAGRTLFGLSNRHIMRAWSDVAEEARAGRARYAFISTDNNCAGMVMRMMACGGAPVFVQPPRALLYRQPNEVLSYSQRVRAEIDRLNTRADVLLTEYQRRCETLDLPTDATLEAAVSAYQDGGLEPPLDIDPATTDALHLMAQARALTLALDESADTGALAVLYAIQRRLLDLNESSARAHAATSTSSAAAPPSRRRPDNGIPARLKSWLSRSFAALPGTRGRTRSSQWAQLAAPQLLRAALRLSRAPEASRGRRFDYLLKASGALALPQRTALLLELADQLPALADGVDRTGALRAAMESLPEPHRQRLLTRVTGLP